MQLTGFSGRFAVLVMGGLLAFPAFATCYQLTADGSDPITATIELANSVSVSPPGARQATAMPWIKSTLTMGGKSYSSAGSGMIVSPSGGIYSSVLSADGFGWAVALQRLTATWTTSNMLDAVPPSASQWEDAYITIIRADDVQEAHKVSSVSECMVPCVISSLTEAVKPIPRERKRIGVGEIVKLSLTTPAYWSLSGAGQLIFPKEARPLAAISMAAGDRGGHIVVSAKSGKMACQIDFDVVEPSEVKMRKTNLIFHHRGIPDSGFQAEVYFRPEDVSFYNIKILEQRARYIANGSFSELNGLSDGPQREWTAVDKWIEGLGSRLALHDNAYTGYPGCTSPPFVASEVTLTIPWQYKVGSSEPKTFATVIYRGTIEEDGKTLTSSKAGAEIKISVDSPTSGDMQFNRLKNKSEIVPCQK